MSKDSKDSWKWSLVSGQVIPEIRAIPSTGYNSTLRHSAQKAARISPDTSTTPEAAFNPKLSEVREEASASSKESRAYATESQSRGHKGSSANSEASSATSRSNKDDLEQRNQAQHHRNQAIAGSIGGLAGAAALAGLGFLLYRRRLNSTSNFKVLKVTHTSSGATSQPPPVSQLQYAKRAPQRMLSVWSHPSEPTSTPPPPNIVAMARNVSSQNMSESSHTSYPYLQPISFGQGDSLGSSARTAPDPFGTLKTDSILSRSDTIKSTESNSWLGYLRGVVSLRSPDIDSSVEATVDSHSPAPTTSSFTPIIDSYTSSDGATVSSRSVKSPRIGTSDVTVTPRLGHHRQQSDIEESEMGYLSEKSPSLSQPQ